MPRAIVDAFNVIGSRPDGWWRDRPRAVRRLVARLDALAGDTGDPITVVVDGRPMPGVESGAVEVVFAPGGRNAADDRIAEIVSADDDPGSLLVITSDRELRRRVTQAGAGVAGAGTLLDRLDGYD